MAGSAPTSLRGYVSEYRYRDILDELVADLPPDLVWPLSVGTYSSMRREAHINAALNGYTLQLRRAQWQLDGRGCRPEVTKLVAEDMGLLVAGDDEAGAARIRGVSWNDHLRAALLYLTFGHAGFELAAKVQEGKARLVGLAERLPHTISQIFSDPRSGEFLGITQTMNKSTVDKPQISADRMAWYCHEREGASWAGVSILRSIFPAFIVKREMLKVHALANRRWGMGVPVMEALPGTNPSPEQMSQAMQLAAAARAGEQSGAATPPGFAMRIMGISGSVPSTLDFLRFLNQEISSGLLMPHMDLGSTPNGSRALGESFTDSWLLALGSLGEEICDVATRQIAARIVEWNFGPDEPVPSVVVSGIGAKRDVTAESLQLLLSSGALAADPGLEAWVRREYRLPERETPLPVAAPGADVRAAAPTPVEPDYAELAQQHTQAVQDMTGQWQQQSAPLVDALVAATVTEVAAGTLIGLGMLTVTPTVIAGLAGGVAAGLLGLATASAVSAAAGLAAAGVAVKSSLPARSRKFVQGQAEATARLIAQSLAASAAKEALRLAGPDVDADEVGRAVRSVLEDLAAVKPSGMVAGLLASAASMAQAEGRRAVFERLPAGTRFRATERLDDGNRCKPCAEVDGREFASLAEALKAYPVQGYIHCEGRSRCRGQLVPVITV